ncbi:MAG: hypothetical protein N2515_05240 [Deltaproteobacteria bacterium]|nr:hypothetical protein [Deltaproteobacteria bacterium]
MPADLFAASPIDPLLRHTNAKWLGLRERVLDLISKAEADPHINLDKERDALLCEIARFQSQTLPPFSRLCSARKASFSSPRNWPALPTDAFKYARISVFKPGHDVITFATSGTSTGSPGLHPRVELEPYRRGSLLGARIAILPDGPFDLLLLAPHPSTHPNSSLAFMLALIEEEAKKRDQTACSTIAMIENRVCSRSIAQAIAKAHARNRPIIICGTAFAFAWADELLDSDFELPPRSMVMITGGFKGHRISIDEIELRHRISARFTIPIHHVRGEYGMTELSSPLWELGEEAGVYWIPPWLRVTATHPQTMEELPEGEAGILRFDDPSNLDSCVSIQSADLGMVYRHPSGSMRLRFLGRMPHAEARGCSLLLEEALLSSR